MLIGLTYDLREEYLMAGYTEEETAEFDRNETIDAIESAINFLGYQTERIGSIYKLTKALAEGRKWDMVFNIAEGMFGIGREAQVPALLDAYEIPYVFSDPLVMSLTLHKGMTKYVISQNGIPTADFQIVNAKNDISKINLPFPVFAKPAAEGTGKGIDERSVIRDKDSLDEVVQRLLIKYRQPVLVETFLSGREFTVGIVGTGEKAEVIGIMEVVLLDKAEQDVYSLLNKEKSEELVEYHLVKDIKTINECQTIALNSWNILNCRDGGRVDIRYSSDGKPYFLEVNPLAGLHPDHSDLPIICNKRGISYHELISRILNSALSRIRR